MAIARPRSSLVLPLAGQAPERADAAANRERILCAARRVLEEQGADGLSMNAVAAAAGVGKGTIFRRFGDRDGLTVALLDAHTVELQDAFLFGPPPLGPGAPADERLEAFMRALVTHSLTHLQTMLAAERSNRDPGAVTGSFALHIRRLVEELDPGRDGALLATLVLSAVTPVTLVRALAQGADAERIGDAVVHLLRGVTGSA